MPSTDRPIANIIKSGNGYDLAATNGLILDTGIVIASTNGVGISAIGSNTIVNNGTIAGANFAVNLESSAKITVGLSGTISGNYSAIYSKSGLLITENYGSIYGVTDGVDVYGSTIFTNHGTVRNGPSASYGDAAFYLGLPHLSAKITNNGLIEAKSPGSNAILSAPTNNASDTIINHGTIKGKVGLSSGNDIFDTRSGKVYGTIDGGPGSDKFTGGSGVETMTGGADNDTFYFKTKADNHAIDHITDFARSEGDKIGLSKSFFKLDPGQSVASAFQDITSGGFSKEGVHKHILYNHDTGFLYYDKDGKGGATPIHFATLDTDPSIGSSDILMV